MSHVVEREVRFYLEQLDRVAQHLAVALPVAREDLVVGEDAEAHLPPQEAAVPADRQAVPDRVGHEPAAHLVHLLAMLDGHGHAAVRDLDLVVHAGEIVAVAGVQGNGQTELVEAITGLRLHNYPKTDAAP